MTFHLKVCSDTTKAKVRTSDIDGNLQLAMYKQMISCYQREEVSTLIRK